MTKEQKVRFKELWRKGKRLALTLEEFEELNDLYNIKIGEQKVRDLKHFCFFGLITEIAIMATFLIKTIWG